MKIIAAILFIVIAPGLAIAQQTSNVSKPCGISHWSTTGAACEYAPDLPPFLDSELKLSIPRWGMNDSLPYLPSSYNSLVPDWYVAPAPINRDSMMKMLMQDPVMKEFMRQLLEDSTQRRMPKPLQNSPDPVLPH